MKKLKPKTVSIILLIMLITVTIFAICLLTTDFFNSTHTIKLDIDEDLKTILLEKEYCMYNNGKVIFAGECYYLSEINIDRE